MESRSRRPPTEMWRATLLQIPTLFGRLVFLSSLRDLETGRYSHPSLADMPGGEDPDRTLRNSHQQVFQQWISSGLADQKADLDEYLSTAGGPRYALPYRNLAPSSARDVERQLYLTDLETLLELLRFERGAAFSIPGS
jgi:hypothetical protein